MRTSAELWMLANVRSLQTKCTIGQPPVFFYLLLLLPCPSPPPIKPHLFSLSACVCVRQLFHGAPCVGPAVPVLIFSCCSVFQRYLNCGRPSTFFRYTSACARKYTRVITADINGTSYWKKRKMAWMWRIWVPSSRRAQYRRSHRWVNLWKYSHRAWWWLKKPSLSRAREVRKQVREEGFKVSSPSHGPDACRCVCGGVTGHSAFAGMWN